MTPPIRSRCHQTPLAVRLHRALGWLLLLSLTGCNALPITLEQVTDSIDRFFDNPWQNPFQPQPNAEQPPSAAAAPLKLGMLFSLSGELARYGRSMQDSTSLLVETVNSCVGVTGQAVQLFLEDDQSNATAGKAAMTRLANNGVGAVIGAIGSEVSNATVDLAVKNQIVQISPASANAILTQRALKGQFEGYWFRTMPPEQLQGEALARLAQQKNLKTVKILAIDNDYGNSIIQAFTETAKQLGDPAPLQVIRYSPDASIYSIDLVSAFSEQPDAVLVVAQPELGGDLLKAAFESGIWSGATKALLSASMRTDGLARRVGISPDGRYNASNSWGISLSSSNALPQFRELYKQRFDREPGLYDPNTWDAAAVVVLAAEAAQSTSGNAIRGKMTEVASDPGVEVSDICQALALVREGKDINYQGTSGTLDFNQAGDAVGIYDVWTIDYTGAIKPERTKIQVGRSTRIPAAKPAL